MDLVVCKDADEVGRFAHTWIASQVAPLSNPSVYLPAGATPEPLYRHWRDTCPEFLSSLCLVQIDDVVGGPKAHLFRKFFIEQLEFWSHQFDWIEAGDRQADLAVLGLGLNGHVGFHEPGLSSQFFSGCVRLSTVTEQRLGLPPGSWGISYGIGAFMRCRAILLLVTGESKREILEAFLQRRGDFPALALRRHSNLTVVVDQAAHLGR